MSNIAIEAAKEIQNIAQENNVDVHNLIEQYKKAYSLTDQDKENTQDIRNKNIIPQKVGVNHR